ncbi:MAG: lysophospholipid acyltransferase family protein [Alphaproteobacteria bacterium]|nr:lysophospholipid acyltransferase family protein [Alphaproteobacteria bacterium]
MKISWLKNIINTKTFNRIVGNLAYCYLKFVGMTTRWKSVSGVKEMYEMLEKHGSMIVIGWHGRVLEMPYFWNKSKTLNALVSPHRDGQYIVKILEKFGIGHVSGSSNKNPTIAALELMSNLQQGNSIAIIPDGPRGPSMKMSMSPIFYAQKSGKPIVGITYSVAHSFIVKKSWDNMMIPFPFCKGMYAITEPLFVPANASPEEMSQYCLQMEKQLNDLTWKMDKEMGIPFIAQGTEVKLSRREKKAGA